MTGEPTRCPDCGLALRQGVRLSMRTAARVQVLVCLDGRTGEGCGYESPHLYRRSRWYRNSFSQPDTASGAGEERRAS